MLPVILASASSIRQSLLQDAGVVFESHPVRIDEDIIRAAMVAEGVKPRDMADSLGEFKARKASQRHPEALVIGADQILALDGEVFAKPIDRTQATEHLERLSGTTHRLFSAAVIYEGGKPVWRHVGMADMTMHRLTVLEIETYLDRAWPDVASSVGAYHAEALGAQLFSHITGDWFSVLGLPLLEVLSYLRLRGMLVP